MKYSALIGNPVEHSVSPQLFEILSKQINLEYTHIKIKVDQKDSLLKVMDAMKELKFIGFNITIPYKLDMFELVDIIDEETKKIHSINSVAFRNGKTIGINTDGKAAIKSIEHFRKILPEDKIVVFGAGGTAYSILFELSKITKNIIVFNEKLDKAHEMCKVLNLPEIECFTLEALINDNNALNEAMIIINATSVGMAPDENSILSSQIIKSLKSKKIFFDVVFNPTETKLLKTAKKYNHIAISGVYMLVYQATLVLDFWLDHKTKYTKNSINKLVLQMCEILGDY